VGIFVSCWVPQYTSYNEDLGRSMLDCHHHARKRYHIPHGMPRIHSSSHGTEAETTPSLAPNEYRCLIQMFTVDQCAFQWERNTPCGLPYSTSCTMLGTRVYLSNWFWVSRSLDRDLIGFSKGERLQQQEGDRASDAVDALVIRAAMAYCRE